MAMFSVATSPMHPWSRTRQGRVGPAGCMLHVPHSKAEPCTMRAHPKHGCSHVAAASLPRRTMLLEVASGMGLMLWPAQQATAATLDFTSVLSKAFPPPPQPVLFPRKPLNQRFAVLLMRSSYEAVDALDFIPMDSFQVKFWKYRQSEQEAYNLQYQPLRVRQGDLTDPLYFDFISYAQYAAIGREMPQGQQVFKEFCEDCPDQVRVVRRDPAMSDNSQLPSRFYTLTGDLIYTGLKDGFRGEQFGAPGPLSRSSSLSEVVGRVQQIMDIMVDRGYALKATVRDVSTTPVPSFTVNLQGPANLWGLGSLGFRRCPVVNAYDALVVDAFLRASGKQASYEVSYTDTGSSTTWTLT